MAEDVTKLPKWAQLKISGLEAQVAERDRRIDCLLSDGDPVSGLSLDMGLNRHVNLPNRVRFHINLGWKSEIRDRVDFWLEDGWVKIMGGRGLMIEPEVTNVIRVRLVDR